MYGIFTHKYQQFITRNTYLGISTYFPYLEPVYNGLFIAHLYAAKVSAWGPAVMFGFFSAA